MHYLTPDDVVNLTITKLEQKFKSFKNLQHTEEELKEIITPYLKEALKSVSNNNKALLKKKLSARLYTDKIDNITYLNKSNNTVSATSLSTYFNSNPSLKNVPMESLESAYKVDGIFSEWWSNPNKTALKVQQNMFDPALYEALSDTIFYDYKRYTEPFKSTVYLVSALTNVALGLLGTAVIAGARVYLIPITILSSIESSLLNYLTKNQYANEILSAKFDINLIKDSLKDRGEEIEDWATDDKLTEKFKILLTADMLHQSKAASKKEAAEQGLSSDAIDAVSDEEWLAALNDSLRKLSQPSVEEQITSQMAQIKKSAEVAGNYGIKHFQLVFNALCHRLTEALPAGKKFSAALYRLVLLPFAIALLVFAIANELIRLPGKLLLQGAFIGILFAKVAITIALNLPLYLVEGISSLFSKSPDDNEPEPGVANSADKRGTIPLGNNPSSLYGQQPKQTSHINDIDELGVDYDITGPTPV
jgi:hypothetical protein